MIKYLVDADVLSEATKPQPNPLVLEWLTRSADQLAISPIVLGELHYGILLLPAGRKQERLLSWFSHALNYLPVLDFDVGTGSVWAKLLSELRRKGRSMPVKDSLIAATARQHRLIIATRNTKDFSDAGVQLVNPFE
jgi:toxin FitB